MSDTGSAFAERVSQGFYLNIDVDRPTAARYGLTVADVQRVVTSEIGGMNITENLEGRRRFPVAVRYERGSRDTSNAVEQALIATPTGEQIPLNQVARVSYSRGPAMIRDDAGQLTGYVYISPKSNDYGGYVARAQKLIADTVQVPAGYTWRWAGEYEFQLRAKER